MVVDPQDYASLLDYLKGDQDDEMFRRKLAWKAFQHVAAYDSAVSEWLWNQTGGGMFMKVHIMTCGQNFLLREPLRVKF